MPQRINRPAATSKLTASAVFGIPRRKWSQFSVLYKVWLGLLPLTLAGVIAPSAIFLDRLRESTTEAHELLWRTRAKSLTGSPEMLLQSQPTEARNDAWEGLSADGAVAFQFAYVTTAPPDEGSHSSPTTGLSQPVAPMPPASPDSPVEHNLQADGDEADTPQDSGHVESTAPDPLLAELNALSANPTSMNIQTVDAWQLSYGPADQTYSPRDVFNDFTSRANLIEAVRDQSIQLRPESNQLLIFTRSRWSGATDLYSLPRPVELVSMLTVSLDPLDQRLTQHNWTAIYILAAVVSFLLPTVYLTLSMLIISPVQRLARTMRTAKPETLLDLRVPVDRHDEIGELQGAFNLLASVISDKQRQLRGTNEELQRSNEDLKAFAYTVSHDLQTPLRNVAFIVSEELPDALRRGREEEALKLAAEAGERCQVNIEMIQEILAWSRVGREKITIEAIDLNEMVAEVQQNLRQKIHEEHVAVQTERLPTVYGRRSELQRVLQNLVTNAIKYNDRSEKRVDIGCRPDKDGRTALFVRDNGIGIRERHLSELFKPFKRLHGQSMYGGGTGMGLAIVRRIVESYNGRAWVESELGQGSTFWITLPPIVSQDGVHNGPSTTGLPDPGR